MRFVRSASRKASPTTKKRGRSPVFTHLLRCLFFALYRRDELRAHCLSQLLWRQQTLVDDEIVERLAVELRSENQPGIKTQLLRAHVAVKIRGGLAWAVEGVAIELLPCHRLGQADVLGQYVMGTLTRDHSQVEHRIEIGTRRTQQASLQRGKLTGWRLVLQHFRLRVERPPFDVDAIESEQAT